MPYGGQIKFLSLLNFLLAISVAIKRDTLQRRSPIWNFLGLIFSSFFRWWWVAITGTASIASFLLLFPTGIQLTPLTSGILMFFGSALLFLTLSTVYQGWIIFQNHFEDVELTGFLKNDCYGGEHIFLLHSSIEIPQGTILEFRRFHEGAELAIALAENMGKNSKGEYQARIIWFSSIHLNELKTGKYVYSDIIANHLVQFRTIEKTLEERKKQNPACDTHE